MTLFCQCFSMTLSTNPDFELDLEEFAWSDLCLSWLSLSLHGNNDQLLFIQHKINSSIRWLYWLDLWWGPPWLLHIMDMKASWWEHTWKGVITQRGKKPERLRYQSLLYNFLMRTNWSPMKIPLIPSNGSTLNDLQRCSTYYGLHHLQPYSTGDQYSNT